VVDSVLKKEFAFKVTPKGLKGARRLPSRVIAPYLLLAAVEAGAAILVRNPGPATGYYFLALLYSATYVVAAGAAVALHLREQGTRLETPALWPRARLVVRPLSFAVLAAIVMVAAGATRWGQASTVLEPSSLVSGRATEAALVQQGERWLWTELGPERSAALRAHFPAGQPVLRVVEV
jgi:hypothetical protein